MRKYKSIFIIFIIIAASVCIDIVTKNIANSSLKLLYKKEIIDGFFYFTLCYNTGGAWSIFSGNVPILIIVSLICLGIVVYTVIKSKSSFYKYSSALFIGGLLGNLYDRIVYGKVIDFLDFVILGYDFPVFNIADCFICVGVGLMMIAMIREEKNNEKIRIEN